MIVDAIEPRVWNLKAEVSAKNEKYNTEHLFHTFSYVYESFS